MLTIFARFHAREGCTDALAKAVRDVVPPSRAEAGCLSIEAFGSIQDSALIFIHSRWEDEAAFERHAGLAHTVEFLAAVASLIDQPSQIARTKPLDPGQAPTERQSKLGDVRWISATSHIGENTGSTEMCGLIIELKDSGH